MTTIQKQPPGRGKILGALSSLLETNDFGSIKIADIAKTAGVTEPLIYKYFKDKRDVLYHLLEEYLEHSLEKLENHLKNFDGTLNKLREFIYGYIHTYNNDRVIARVILLEVRNLNDYYESASYKILRQYNNLIFSVLEDGVRNGEIRDDIPLIYIGHLIFGTIDRSCLSPVIFNKPFDADATARHVTTLIFDAIRKDAAIRIV
jgi:TetR/AcrR family transcriptional regulator, fatty acid metabolism regulator protein